MTENNSKSGKSKADRLALAAGFPASSDETWQGLVQRILGDRSIEETLVRETYDGIAIRPLYTAKDWRPDDETSGFPGLPPFTRGHSPIGQVKTGWAVRQLHAHPVPAACNVEILEDLTRGVTSIELCIDRAGRRGLGANGASEDVGIDGVTIADIGDLDEVLDGVYLDACPVSLRAGAAFLPVSAMLFALLARRGVDAASFAGALNADPLSNLVEFGMLPASAEALLGQLGALARYAAMTCPAATAVAVDTTCYHNAGASEAQELACGLATGAAYLRAMTASGLDLDGAFAQVAFTYAADAELFLSIAKLRAARKLWGRVAEACGVSTGARGVRLHVSTSERMMSRRDPWVNILRGTVATLGASVAGVDSMTVLPFTAAIGLPNAAARRIARNTQLVLQQEASLSRVIDPAGGSWAIENLTDAIAQEAWKLFQEIEGEGGLLASLRSGKLQGRIAAVSDKRAGRVGTIGDPLTGVSAFPNLAEQPVSVETVDLEALRKAALAKSRKSKGQAGAGVDALRTAAPEAIVEGMIDCAASGASLSALMEAAERGESVRVKPLVRWRLGEAFEALRDASDAYFEKTGKRPTVFLATIGALARFTTAAAYARNFLAAGGIDAVAGSGGTDADAIALEFRASGAGIAVVCSDRPGLRDFGGDVAESLAGAGAQEVFVVGEPEGDGGTLRAAAVKGFLYEGCDVLAVLRGMLERSGVLQK